MAPRRTPAAGSALHPVANNLPAGRQVGFDGEQIIATRLGFANRMLMICIRFPVLPVSRGSRESSPLIHPDRFLPSRLAIPDRSVGKREETRFNLFKAFPARDTRCRGPRQRTKQGMRSAPGKPYDHSPHPLATLEATSGVLPRGCQFCAEGGPGGNPQVQEN